MTDGVLEASPKQMALDEGEHHLPTKQLSGSKKRNAKCGLSPQYASNSWAKSKPFQKYRGKNFETTGKLVPTCDKTKE